MLASLDAVHARRAAGQRARTERTREAPSPSWRQSSAATNNIAVRKIVERSRGRGGLAVRSALVNAPVQGVGEGGACVPGQAAPASLQLGKRRVRGGRITDNRKSDCPHTLARLLNEDEGRVIMEVGFEPSDAAAAAQRRNERMWTCHAEWSVCLGAWASAYALQLRAASSVSTRALRAKAHEELFKAHRMVGKVAERIGLQRNDPLCLLEVPGARDGGRLGAAPEASLQPPILPSEQRLQALIDATDPAVPFAQRATAAREAATEQQRVAAATTVAMRTPMIQAALHEENVSQLYAVAPGTPRHGAAVSSIAGAIADGPSGVTVNGRAMGQGEVEAALRLVRAGHDTRAVVDTSRRTTTEEGTDAQVHAVLADLATACGSGKLSVAQMQRVEELVATYKNDVRS